MASPDEEADLQQAIGLSIQQSRSASPASSASSVLELYEVSKFPEDSVVRDHPTGVHPDCHVCKLLAVKYHSFSLEDLKGQRNKCQLCTLLWNGITAALGSHLRDTMTHADVRRRGVDGNGPLVISVRYHQRWNRILQFYCPEEGSTTPWPEIGIGSEVGSSGLSNCTILRARQWLEECTTRGEAHPHCRLYDAEAAKLPRRVINVGTCDEDPVRLHVPNDGDVGRYIALSHCWGDGTPIKTTTDNYGQHTSEIPLPLPQTFMDAVRVVRALGVQYLWIDSLCIIQNSAEDWNEQAPQMASIYGNAYCTIAADAAENSSSGFVEGSRRNLHTPKVLEYTHDGQKGTVLVRPHETTYPQQPLHDFSSGFFRLKGKNDEKIEVKDTIDHAPYSKLFTRAWVFQERMLSRRTLHFGHAECGWECRSFVDCECSPYNKAYGPMNTEQLSLKSMMDVYPWNSIVAHFSKLDITFATDRLIALSGLAKARYQVTGDIYLAGLWAGDLKGGLLWQVDHYHTGQQQPTRLDIAPTWSWASVSAPVAHYFGSSRHDNGDHKKCCLDWKLKAFSIRGRGRPDLFASSIQVTITIEGLLLMVNIDDPQTDDDKWSSTTLYRIQAIKQDLLTGNTQPPTQARVAWDIAYDERSTYTLFVTSRDLDQHMQGIVLTAEDEESHYKRCGILDIGVYNRGPDPWKPWSDYMELQTFHIS